jgi:hypothetical protein
MYNVENYESVMQTESSETVSDRYSFIPTTQVLDVFKSQGWTPSKVSQVSARKEETRGYQKHMIRLRQNLNDMQVGDLFPEIVLTNSHCGSASFQVMAGLFRLVCSNGLTVADSTFQTHRIKHIGYTDQKVVDATYSIIEETPKILEKVNEFKAIELSKDERQIFGESAIDLLYTEEEIGEKKMSKGNTAQRMIMPIRNADAPTTLWNTFNTIQEKITKGRIPLMNMENKYRVGMTRKIKSIDKDIKLNKALWTLTEKMAELKK